MWGWQESNQAATEHLHREASLCLPPTIQWWEDSCPRAPETSNTNQHRIREKNILIPKVGLQWSVKLVPSRALEEKTPQVSFQLPMASNHWSSLTCGYSPISPFSHMTPPFNWNSLYLHIGGKVHPSLLISTSARLYADHIPKYVHIHRHQRLELECISGENLSNA